MFLFFFSITTAFPHFFSSTFSLSLFDRTKTQEPTPSLSAIAHSLDLSLSPSKNSRKHQSDGNRNELFYFHQNPFLSSLSLFYFFPDFALQAAIHSCASFLRSSGVSAAAEGEEEEETTAGGAAEEEELDDEEEGEGVWSCFCIAARPAKAAASTAATGV